jgi:AbiV family abortive infection protein
MGFNQLTVKDLESIYLKVYQNACELIEEAEILYNHEKFARSHACAQFSIEEFGKLPMLTSIAIKVSKDEKVDWKDLQKRIRNHQSKTSLSFALIGPITRDLLKDQKVINSEQHDYIDPFPQDLQEFKKVIEDYKFKDNIIMESLLAPKSELESEYRTRKAIATVLNKYKNLSLYADFNEGNFVKPNEIINEKSCRKRIRAALIEKKLIDFINIHNKGFSYGESDFKLYETIINNINEKFIDDK